MSKRKRNNPGFTIVEIMVAVILTAIIGLGVFSTLQAGMNVWKRVSVPLATHHKIILGLERLFREVRSSAAYYNPPFKFFGQEDRIMFVNINDDRIHFIEYYYSSEDGCLYRRSRTKQQTARGEMPTVRKVAAGIRSFSFEYTGIYFESSHKVNCFKGPYWKTRWGLPGNVRVNVVLKDGSRFEKTVLIRGFSVWTC